MVILENTDIPSEEEVMVILETTDVDAVTSAASAVVDEYELESTVEAA